MFVEVFLKVVIRCLCLFPKSLLELSQGDFDFWP